MNTCVSVSGWCVSWLCSTLFAGRAGAGGGVRAVSKPGPEVGRAGGGGGVLPPTLPLLKLLDRCVFISKSKPVHVSDWLRECIWKHGLEVL